MTVDKRNERIVNSDKYDGKCDDGKTKIEKKMQKTKFNVVSRIMPLETFICT